MARRRLRDPKGGRYERKPSVKLPRLRPLEDDERHERHPDEDRWFRELYVEPKGPFR
jgi:hypothetical protein